MNTLNIKHTIPLLIFSVVLFLSLVYFQTAGEKVNILPYATGLTESTILGSSTVPPAKLAVAAPSKARSVSVCRDHDNGKNYNVQSTAVVGENATDVLRTVQDECYPDSSGTLIEYYCLNNQIESVEYKCPYGCLSGACKQAPGKGTIYVIHAVDTEELGLNPLVYSNTLDLSNFGQGSDVASVFQDAYRNSNLDSFGGPIKLSWYMMTHEAYCNSTQAECNPILKKMKEYSPKATEWGDYFGWHYHLSDWSDLNNDGKFFWNQLLTFNNTAYTHGTDIGITEKILASQLLEQHFYPSSTRMGWVWENTDFSNWLDDIAPFDLSSLAPFSNTDQSPDGIGNIYDWRKALTDWSFYHPSRTDYQQGGDLKRYEFKCGGSFTDLFTAFKRADQGQDVLVCTYIHTYYEYFDRYSLLYYLKVINDYYPEVKFKFVNALEGIRLVLNLPDELPPWAVLTRQGNVYTLTVNKPLYTFPFGAIKISTGQYARVKPTSLSPTVADSKYVWTFDLSSIDYQQFAIGGVDKVGNTFVTNTYYRQ